MTCAGVQISSPRQPCRFLGARQLSKTAQHALLNPATTYRLAHKRPQNGKAKLNKMRHTTEHPHPLATKVHLSTNIEAPVWVRPDDALTALGRRQNRSPCVSLGCPAQLNQSGHKMLAAKPQLLGARPYVKTGPNRPPTTEGAKSCHRWIELPILE